MTKALFTAANGSTQEATVNGQPLPVQAWANPVYVLQSAAQAVSGSAAFSTAAVAFLAVDITLTSFTGGTTPSITFYVDRLGADGNWYPVYTSAVQSVAGTVSASIGPGTGNAAALTQQARFRWSTTGAPTAVTFSASVVGR